MAPGHSLLLQSGIPYILLLVVSPAALSAPNFYQQKSTAYDNDAYGKTCYNFRDYRPTCGWKTIIKSPVPLISVTFPDQSVEQIDNYTFITTNKEWNGDFTRKTTQACSNIQYTGSFGNKAPFLFVTWYCICDTATFGVCELIFMTCKAVSVTTVPGCCTLSCIYQKVYVEDDATEAPPSTEAAATTSTTTTTLTTTTATTTKAFTSTSAGSTLTTLLLGPSASVSAAVLPSEGESNPGPWSIPLQKMTDTCYTGTMYTQQSTVHHLVDCASSCLQRSSCKGINFKQATKQCDLVYDDKSSGTWQVTVVVNCTFWCVLPAARRN